jgi:hypothetical protein
VEDECGYEDVQRDGVQRLDVDGVPAAEEVADDGDGQDRQDGRRECRRE